MGSAFSPPPMIYMPQYECEPFSDRFPLCQATALFKGYQAAQPATAPHYKVNHCQWLQEGGGALGGLSCCWERVAQPPGSPSSFLTNTGCTGIEPLRCLPPVLCLLSRHPTSYPPSRLCEAASPGASCCCCCKGGVQKGRAMSRSPALASAELQDSQPWQEASPQ